jgi:hypothetical protein
VQQALGEVAGEVRVLLDILAHAVVAERDLAEEPAGVGEINRAELLLVGLEFADVVQERSAGRDVAVSPEDRAERVDAVGDIDGVLE